MSHNLRNGSDAHEQYLLPANNNSLWIRVHSGNGMAHWALDVHEEGVWRLNLSLELVLGCLEGWVNVK